VADRLLEALRELPLAAFDAPRFLAPAFGRRRPFPRREAVLPFRRVLLAFPPLDARERLDPEALLRREDGLAVAFDLGRARIPIASRAVAVIGLPVAADFPAKAPTIPPTTAPIGPATLPSTAPVAAPTAGLEIGGIVMFSFDCCSLDWELSVGSSGISGSSVVFNSTSDDAWAAAASS
jgi:hypothetical protein